MEELSIGPGVRTDPGEQRVVRPPPVLVEEWWRRNFVECVRSGCQPATSAERGLYVTRIIDALYQSAEEGREVVLDPPVRVRGDPLSLDARGSCV